MAESSESRCGPCQYPCCLKDKCACPRIRKVGSKAAVLVAVWTYIAIASFDNLVLSSMKFVHLQSAVAVSIATVCSIAIVSAPFAGLVATVYFGRWKVIRTSIWLMWIEAVTIAIVEVLLELVPGLPQTPAYSVIVAALIIFGLGLVTFVVNSVPFGLDQMPDASSEQITAFVHWYVWLVGTGLATSFTLKCIALCTNNLSLVHSLVSAILLTLTLISSFLLRQWLIIEPESKNPLRLIYKVLKYAAKHKVPVRRSAFTYWEPEIPSRINLGKSKYGGPFSTEEVEDTKTCLKMLLVIVTVSVTVTSFAAYLLSFKMLHVMLISPDRCHRNIVGMAIALVSCILYSTPVYDTLAHAVSRKCVYSTLTKAGFAQALTVCAQIIFLVISALWYDSTSPDQCLFTFTHRPPTLSLDYRVIQVPLYFINIVISFLFFSAMLEFVCAQAPYNLRGLLVGVLQSTILLGTALGGVILGAWTIGYKHNVPDNSMCGIWFYLFTTIIAILGCVIWCVVAKCYKKRERAEPEMCRIFAENYYEKYN